MLFLLNYWLIVLKLKHILNTNHLEVKIVISINYIIMIKVFIPYTESFPIFRRDISEQYFRILGL